MRHQGKLTPISKDDRAFFDDFVVKYERFILYTAQKYERPDIPAEDIRQEAEIRLMKRIPKLRTLTHNGTCSYISETVKTTFIDLKRKEQRHCCVSMDSVLEEIVGMEYDVVPDLFICQELQRLRKHLSPRQWLALEGKYILGYSPEELAKLLEIAPESVRTFLLRTRKQSREILSPEKVTGGDGDDN